MMRVIRVGVRSATVALIMASGAARADEPPPSAATQQAIPGRPEYRTSWFHNIFMGAGYRKIWTTPIEFPVLDLAGFAGGLHAGAPGRLDAEHRPRSRRGATAGATPSARPTRTRRASFHPSGPTPSPRSCSRTRPSPTIPASASSCRLWPRPRACCTRRRATCSCPTTPALGEFREDFRRPAGDHRGVPAGRGRRRARLRRGEEIVSTAELWKRSLAGRPDPRRRPRPAPRADASTSGSCRTGTATTSSGAGCGFPARDGLRAAARGPRPGLLEVRRPAAGRGTRDAPEVHGVLTRLRELRGAASPRAARSIAGCSRASAGAPSRRPRRIAAARPRRRHDRVGGEAACRREWYALGGVSLTQALQKRRDGLRAGALRVLRAAGAARRRPRDGSRRPGRDPRESGGAVLVRIALAGEVVPYFERRFDPRETRRDPPVPVRRNRRVTTAPGPPAARSRCASSGGGRSTRSTRPQSGGTRFYDFEGRRPRRERAPARRR